MYDYLKSMKEDITEALENDYLYHYETPNAMAEDYDNIYNDLWLDDSVTGNGSGSYTFNRSEAKDYVLDNTDLLKEAYEEFGSLESLGTDFCSDDYEKMDVTIRCYLLSEALSDVIDDFKYWYELDHEL